MKLFNDRRGVLTEWQLIDQPGSQVTAPRLEGPRRLCSQTGPQKQPQEQPLFPKSQEKIVKLYLFSFSFLDSVYVRLGGVAYHTPQFFIWAADISLS